MAADGNDGKVFTIFTVVGGIIINEQINSLLKQFLDYRLYRAKSALLLAVSLTVLKCLPKP